MPQTTGLYEHLGRWDDEHKFAGYHVTLLTVTKDDAGKIIAKHVSDPMTPAQAEALGYPIAEILSSAHVDASATIAAHEATITEKAADHATELAARQAKEQEAATLAVEKEALAAENALLKMPEKERERAEKRAQIAKLQAEIDAAEVVEERG